MFELWVRYKDLCSCHKPCRTFMSWQVLHETDVLIRCQSNLKERWVLAWARELTVLAASNMDWSWLALPCLQERQLSLPIWCTGFYSFGSSWDGCTHCASEVNPTNAECLLGPVSWLALPQAICFEPPRTFGSPPRVMIYELLGSLPHVMQLFIFDWAQWPRLHWFLNYLGLAMLRCLLVIPILVLKCDVVYEWATIKVCISTLGHRF